jgi:hypothetical protein
MILLEGFPNEYDARIQKTILERFLARAGQLKYERYFNVESTDQYKIISDKVSSLGAMDTWADGADVSLDDPLNEGTYTMTQAGYGLGFKVGRHMLRYNMRNLPIRWSAALADSAIQTLRAKHASVLNNGFSTSYAYRESGVALISASHTTAGSTRSNILAAATALSHAAYDALRQVAGNHVDYRGKLNPLNVDQLIVPLELEKAAREITGSPQKPYTTDNEINAFFAEAGPIVEEHLTSATAWFLRDSTSMNLSSYHGLPFRVRTFPEFSSDSQVYFGEMDFAYGAEDWEGIVGSAGA